MAKDKKHDLESTVGTVDLFLNPLITGQMVFDEQDSQFKELWKQSGVPKIQNSSLVKYFQPVFDSEYDKYGILK